MMFGIKLLLFIFSLLLFLLLLLLLHQMKEDQKWVKGQNVAKLLLPTSSISTKELHKELF